MSFSKCSLTPLTRVGVTVRALRAISSTFHHGYGHLSVTYNCLVCTNLTPTSAVGGPFLKVYILSIFFAIKKNRTRIHIYFFTSKWMYYQQLTNVM